MKFSLYFLYFSSDRDRIGAGGTPKKNVLDCSGFCANWRSKSDTLHAGVNVYPYILHLLSNLGEIRYK